MKLDMLALEKGSVQLPEPSSESTAISLWHLPSFVAAWVRWLQSQFDVLDLPFIEDRRLVIL